MKSRNFTSFNVSASHVDIVETPIFYGKISQISSILTNPLHIFYISQPDLNHELTARSDSFCHFSVYVFSPSSVPNDLTHCRETLGPLPRSCCTIQFPFENKYEECRFSGGGARILLFSPRSHHHCFVNIMARLRILFYQIRSRNLYISERGRAGFLPSPQDNVILQSAILVICQCNCLTPISLSVLPFNIYYINYWVEVKQPHSANGRKAT